MPDSQTLAISIRRLDALVKPVLPFAVRLDMLPVLTAVHIKSHGPWLVAEATDRFRLAMHRQKATEGVWPEWEALIPLKSLKAILATFKPARGFDPEVTLSIEDGNVVVELDGGLGGGLFSEARVAYPLETDEFPKVGGLVTEALAASPEVGDRRFNWSFLADFKAADPNGTGLTVHHGPKATVVTDEENFVGIIMPRFRQGTQILTSNTVAEDLASWVDILTPPTAKAEPKPKAKRTRKAAAEPVSA